jgi:membrane-associated PAP2 superfamily phosphatase
VPIPEAKVKKQLLLDIGVPLLVLVGLTVLLQQSGADMAMDSRFHIPGSGVGGWLYRTQQPWAFLYAYAWVPALLMTVAAMAALLLRRYRKMGIFVVLLLFLGPGLMVNMVFKDHWGRPRPKEIIEFGGQYHYHPVWQKGEAVGNGSFPSGHAAIGFFLMAPYFILRRRHPGWAKAFLVGGTLAGGLVGYARMGQGGHFATDVIWAWGFVYFTGLTLAHFFRFDAGMADEKGNYFNKDEGG